MLFALCCAPVFAADDAAILATLVGARKVTTTAGGFQMVSHNGTWMRAVRTADGGFCIFGTNGSARLFPTPMGYGFNGGSNDFRSVTVTPRGFAVRSESGTVSMVRAGSAWIAEGAPDNFRVIVDGDGYATYSGPLAPTPADTAFELFQQRQAAGQLNPEPAFVAPPPAADRRDEPALKIRPYVDRQK